MVFSGRVEYGVVDTLSDLSFCLKRIVSCSRRGCRVPDSRLWSSVSSVYFRVKRRCFTLCFVRTPSQEETSVVPVGSGEVGPLGGLYRISLWVNKPARRPLKLPCRILCNDEPRNPTPSRSTWETWRRRTSKREEWGNSYQHETLDSKETPDLVSRCLPTVTLILWVGVSVLSLPTRHPDGVSTVDLLRFSSTGSGIVEKVFVPKIH